MSRAFKKSLITAVIFFLAYISLDNFISITFEDFYKDYALGPIMLMVCLFFVVLFYFLFKFQDTEIIKKDIFYMLPLKALVIGTSLNLIYVFHFFTSCDEMECMAIPIVFSISIICTAPIWVIISLILSFNLWYKTNLYIVAGAILAFVILSQLLAVLFGDIFIWLSPLGILLGTIIAIYLSKNKKINPEEEQRF